MVFRTDRVHLSSRLRRTLRTSTWRVRADTDFAGVIEACARAPRPGQHGTWITRQMRSAYRQLHALGHAHSVEVHGDEGLVGGIYGVAIGRMFFGESMFSARSNGSRLALAALARTLAGWGWPLVDAQVDNPHLRLLGAREMARPAFADAIAVLVDQPGRVGSWREAFGERPVGWLATPVAP